MRHALWTALFVWASVLAVPRAEARDTTVRSADGQRIPLTYDGTGTTGVLIVPGEGETAARFAGLSSDLVKAGFLVATLELRGHGASTLPLDEAAWAAVDDDVEAALAWLSGRSGVTRVVVIGSGLGGTLALAAASDAPTVVDAVLVSPTLSAHGHSLIAPLSAWGARPMLLMVGADDDSGRRTAGAIASKVEGRSKVAVSTGTGKGAQVLADGAKAHQTVLAWITETLSANPAASSTVKMGELGAVETTGKRFGER